MLFFCQSVTLIIILKDHPNVMAVITQRARNLEIVRRLWHSKDAKTAVEQGSTFFTWLSSLFYTV